MRKYFLTLLALVLISSVRTQVQSASLERKLSLLGTKQFVNAIFEADMRSEIPPLSKIQIAKLNYLAKYDNCTESDVLAILNTAQGGTKKVTQQEIYSSRKNAVKGLVRQGLKLEQIENLLLTEKNSDWTTEEIGGYVK